MTSEEILQQLEETGIAVIATVDEAGRPQARHIHIGAANDQGIFFMTSPHTAFYDQLMATPHIALASKNEEGYLIQIIRITGKVRPIGKEKLQELLDNNPYVDQVYPDGEVQASMQVFHLYEGEGFYHSLTQGHRYTFTIQAEA